MKKYLNWALKIFLWLVGTIVVLLLLVLILVNIPSVQNLAKDKIVTYIQDKIHTKVSVDHLQIKFPQQIVLEGVYFQDQKKDTLLAGQKLAVDVSLLQLINNKLTIDFIDLQGITANIDRNEKGVFNFDYIVKAFASQDTITKTSTPLVISLDEINVDKLKFNFKDSFAKNYVALYLNHFDTRIETFDLDSMNFKIPKIKINGLSLKLKQGIVNTVANVEDANNDKSTLKIDLGEIDLSKIKLDYQDEKSKLATDLSLKKLLVKFEKMDIGNQLLLINKIDLSDVDANIAFGKLKKIIDNKIVDKKIAENSTNNWDVKVKDLNFTRVGFIFDDYNSPPVKRGIDYKHLKISALNTTLESIHYSPISTSATIKSFRAKEKSGLDIQSFKSDFFYGTKNSFFKNLYFKTPQTLVRNQIEIGYPSIESISKNPGDLSINASIKKSSIGFKDILIFMPDLSKTNPFKDNPNAILLVDSEVSGKLKSLVIPKLEISGIGTTKLNASGKITGLPDVNKATFDLVINKFQSSAKDINGFVPKNTIPNSIQLPANFNLSGSFKGSINDFYTNLSLGSTYGNAKIKGTFNQKIKNKERYNAVAEFKNFNLGKLIKNPDLGKITLNADVKGTGLNPKTANATVNGTIQDFYYNKYTYQNLDLNGSINNGLFKVEANSNDPNLSFDLVSSGSFRDKYPTGKIKLALDIADLQKLNLHAGPLKIRGNLDANIQSADIDYLNGTFTILNLTIADDKEQFVTDSISLIATSTAAKNTLNLKSPFLNVAVDGKYKLSKIADALSNSVANYYSSKPLKKTKTAEQEQLEFKIAVQDSPLLIKLIPDLKSLEPISISGRYNTVNDTIVMNGSIPKLVYGANTITNAILSIDTKDQALQYNLVVDDIQNSQFQLPYTSLRGKVKDNIVDYTLQLKDLKDKERYFIAGTLKGENDNNNLNFDIKKLVLNYENWKVDANNLIRFGSKGIYANNFELSQNGSSLKLQSESTLTNAPLAVELKDFKIETLSSFAEKSDLQINGIINGSALLKNLTTSPVFTANLIVDNFAFKKDTVGTLNIQVDNKIANTYNAKVSITKQENQVDLAGTYKTGTGNLDFKLDIGKLNLKSIQGFTMGNLTESTGFLNGKFNIVGTTTNPKVSGDLFFNQIGFKVAQLNATFKSMNDKIAFTNEAIAFDHFTIKDAKDNDLVINGKLNSQDIYNLGFDLTIDATNFQALNSKEKDNDLFYGVMYLDNHLRIKGNLDNPIVDGNIKVNKDTKFNIVMPQSDPSIADREGIVEFIDQDNPTLVTKIAVDKDLSKTDITGINASVNIEIDKDAELSIIIDKSNGDFLKLKGEAQLNGGIDPSGKTTLTGRYELKEGAYEMSFNFIKRKFDIENGSYILWTGEPTSADISITAVYKNEAAPIDLIDDQLGNVSSEVRNTYKQKIPFETNLILKGDLMKPSISFDIILPDGNNSVSTEIINATQAKLTQLRSQPDELNKQVFALLLLNRFIGENPFASEAGGSSINSIARQSASKLLSQQLNNLAGNLINGVELNFDLNSTEDYTTGKLENKTDLNVGISKKLLNDRLKVTVGSSFGLEGPQQTNEETSTIAGDVSVEYQLSKDGRYKLRAYRLNKYQVALQGQVVETGVAFTITLDYNKFKELFQKSKTLNKKK